MLGEVLAPELFVFAILMTAYFVLRPRNSAPNGS